MLWTYLSKSNNLSNILNSSTDILNFESINIKHDENYENYENEINSMKKNYSDLIKEGFLDGFSRDYNILFVSKYSPESDPLKKEKLIVLNLK